jgi:hypothetical protein
MIQGINDDNAVRYECAAEILNTMIALNTRELAEEEAKARPNKARITKLTTQRQRLTLERRQLDPDNSAAIEHVFNDYAPMVKEKLDIAPTLG